ncbi:MAG: hypothetical protein HYX55_00525 [Chloroflexi bacterium]|nr:hypothetical protein [Chloroflexota bacterium]
MNKRNLASILWFLAGWQAGGLIVGLMDMPWVLGFAPGIVMVLLVRWDPTGLFWSRSGTGRKIVPINAYAEKLDKRIEQWPVVETDTRRV